MTESKTIFGTAMKPSQVREERGLCIALCGPAGEGKTTLVGTLLDSKHAGKIALFDCEGGSYVLPDDPRLDIFPVKNWQEIVSKRQLAIRDGGKTYQTIVWDNVMKFQRKNLESYGLYNAAPNMTISLYGKSHNDMVLFFQEQQDLAISSGVNVIFIIGDEAERDEASGVTKRALALTPKAANVVTFDLDYIFYVERIGGKYPPTLSSYSPNKVGKLRTPPMSPLARLPNIIYNPSLGELLDVFKGGKWDQQKHARPQGAPATPSQQPANEPN